MTVAIVDYGSGNLHSAAQSVRARRARDRGRPADRGDQRSRHGRACRPRGAAGVGAFADCRRGLDAVAGMVEALETERAARKAGRSSASASACS